MVDPFPGKSSVWKFSFRDKIFKGIKFLTENEFPSSPKHQKFIKNKFEVDVEVHFPGKTLLTVSIECNHASGWGGRTLQMFAWTTLSQKRFLQSSHRKIWQGQVFWLIPCFNLTRPQSLLQERSKTASNPTFCRYGPNVVLGNELLDVLGSKFVCYTNIGSTAYHLTQKTQILANLT